MTSLFRIVRKANGALCLHWVSGAVWAARAILTSAPAAWVFSERWLADFRSRVESLALARSPFVAHNEAKRRRAARAGMWRKWMREEKSGTAPVYMQRVSYIWFSPRYTISLDPFKSQMQSWKNYVWQLFTRNQHTRSQLFECTQFYDDYYLLYLPLGNENRCGNVERRRWNFYN